MATLVIREAQMSSFREELGRGLARDIVRSLRPHFAAQFAVQGEAAVRAAAGLAVERAAARGLLAEREVFLYASLAFMLGSFFDEDAQLPWVRSLLAEDGRPPFSRILQTYDAAMAHLDRTVGADGSAHLRVLARLRKLDLDEATKQVDDEGDADVITLLRKLHPRKVVDLGDEGVARLWSAARERAETYGLSCTKGRLLHLLLMAMLGSRYDLDPQFPWAASILGGEGVGESERTAALRDAAMNHLVRSLATSRTDADEA